MASAHLNRTCFVCAEKISETDDSLSVKQGLDNSPAHRACWSRYKKDYTTRTGVPVVVE